QVTAVIAASEISTGGTMPVTVINPDPVGGAYTPALNFTVNNPLPTTLTLSPASAIAGSGTFTLAVNGGSFVSGATVQFGTTDHAGTVNGGGTQVTAVIAASEILTSGAIPVTVTNPTPGGGASTPALNFTVNNPAPTMGSILPTSKTVGDATFSLTVNGANFNGSSVVRFNGSSRGTTYVSPTQLTSQITPADLLTAGMLPITVFNPTPGG